MSEIPALIDLLENYGVASWKPQDTITTFWSANEPRLNQMCALLLATEIKHLTESEKTLDALINEILIFRLGRGGAIEPLG